MTPIFFLAEAEAGGSPLAALGVNFKAFVIQLLSFVFVFILLKKFAFTPIVKLLDERRKVIDDGVKMGLRMEKEKSKLDVQVKSTLRQARQDADKIIATAQKEAREVIREAEKVAQRKVDTMLSDAQTRIDEEAKQAKRNLEREIVGLVSDVTETIVHEKVDAKKDARLISEALQGHR